MKKKLNFITLLIGIATGISIFNSNTISLLIESGMTGYKQGVDKAQTMDSKDFKLSELNSLFLVTLKPVESYAKPDKLLNKKNGQLMPTRINNVTVVAPTEISASNIFWSSLCTVFVIVGFIMVAFNFLKIILAVNKSVIFEWINVKRLRRMGLGFVIMFVVGAILTYIENHFVSEMIEIENYKILKSPYDGGILMFGVISFLVAEIFALGLKLKEEQDLTI